MVQIKATFDITTGEFGSPVISLEVTEKVEFDARHFDFEDNGALAFVTTENARIERCPELEAFLPHGITYSEEEMEYALDFKKAVFEAEPENEGQGVMYTELDDKHYEFVKLLFDNNQLYFVHV